MADNATDGGRHTDDRPGGGNRHATSRRRAFTWVTSIIGVAAVAFVTAYFTVLGNHVAAIATKPSSPDGQPLLIDAVNILPTIDQSRAFPNHLIVSAQQLHTLNSINQTTPAYQNWFSSRGAVKADSLKIQLIVRGNRENPVRITDIQPVVSCHAPLSGTLFLSPTGGEDKNTQLLINLDRPLEPPSYIVYKNGNVAGGGPDYFSHFTVSLSRDEQFTFEITARALKSYCSFLLDMSVLDGGKTIVEHVKDGNRPFRVTAIPSNFSRYASLYIGGAEANGFPGSGRNTFGQYLWLQADKNTYPNRP